MNLAVYLSFCSWLRNRPWMLVGGLALLTLMSCGGNKRMVQSNQQTFQQQIKNSRVFNEAFTGFLLFDTESGKIIYEQHADRYFTAASNTKIFTLYLSTELLGDSIPALRYVSRGDSLIFWGTGDPSFLNPYLPAQEQVYNFLKSRKEQLFFSSYNFQDQHFGAGWAWDDYYYDFQVEKSAFPIYGNIIRVLKSNQEEEYQLHPAHFSTGLTHQPRLQNKGARVYRNADDNQLNYNRGTAQNQSYEADIPFKYSDELLVKLLSDTLHRTVQLYPHALMPPSESETLYSVPSQKLYRQMMHPSDNFVAEQLLLLCAQQLKDTLNTKEAIAYAQESLFKPWPKTPRWRDGSGLSRYNIFTPRNIVTVLNRLRRKLSRDELFDIFPAGGISGTIENWYGGNGSPYVYAKTGSMSYVHCLSGYVLTSRGRMLIFSFMHNNFPKSSQPYKQEMEKILRQIYLDY